MTTAPDVLVKFMTFPETRPKYFTEGWFANGVTVSVEEEYLVQTRLM